MLRHAPRTLRAVFLALLLSGPACAQQHIHWYISEIAAIHIADGADRQQGFIDQLLFRHLLPGLKDYSQRVDVVPLARREAMLRGDDLHACTPGLFKTPERAAQMEFSQPYLALMSPGVFVRRSELSAYASLLDAQGRLSLQRLLADGQRVVGLVQGRSYGRALDALLDQYRQRPQLYELSKSQGATNLLRMLALGRVAVVPAYPYEASLRGGVPSEVLQQVAFLPLQEQPVYVLNHAACAKGEAGHAAIAAINALIRRDALQDAALGYYQQWLQGDLVERARQIKLRAEQDGAFKP